MTAALTPLERQLLATVERLEAAAVARDERLTQRINDLSERLEKLSGDYEQLAASYAEIVKS